MSCVIPRSAGAASAPAQEPVSAWQDAWAVPMNSTHDDKPKHADFARRLSHALDFSGFAKGRARIGALSIHYNVSRETARKWLLGLSLPELQRMIEIATQQQVSFEWLSTGRGSVDGNGLSVRDPQGPYGDPEEMRLAGLLRRLPRKKRRALIELLDPA